MNRIYLVVFEKGAECWGAFAPDVPGTGGMGDTLEEARISLREGIKSMLQDALERNVTLPAAITTSVDFAEFNPNPADSHFEIEWLTIELPHAQNVTQDQSAQAA